ncbi:hypothetical protein GCM10009779_65090 [Polymorphospora rubra]|uniref:Uncharacterized protein n=1 Tax=Polymorphospora rubra TaxID=338584 RepID=A0A810N711_9ACTN|nr:hypothetical protein Prubr_45890 [Polymorphospora rubra]
MPEADGLVSRFREGLLLRPGGRDGWGSLVVGVRLECRRLRHPCSDRIRAIVDGVRPCWAAQWIRGDRERAVVRVSGEKAARQLRSRVQRSGGKAALAYSTPQE